MTFRVSLDLEGKPATLSKVIILLSEFRFRFF
jgi:hypothetical protein